MEVIEKVRESALQGQSKEDKTMTAIVRAFNGDAAFFARGYRRQNPDDRGVLCTDFARWIIKNATGLRESEQDVEYMLETLAEDRRRKGDVDIERFQRAFEDAREQAGVRRGEYDARGGGAGGASPRGPPRSNPYVAGHAATATRASTERRAGGKRRVPQGFVEPKQPLTNFYE